MKRLLIHLASLNESFDAPEFRCRSPKSKVADTDRSFRRARHTSHTWLLPHNLIRHPETMIAIGDLRIGGGERSADIARRDDGLEVRKRARGGAWNAMSVMRAMKRLGIAAK
jgi:hypothetical protein